MEDVKQSNFAYSQTKIADFLTFYFAVIGIGACIIANEMQLYYNEDDINEEHIKYQYWICIISTGLLSNLLVGC